MSHRLDGQNQQEWLEVGASRAGRGRTRYRRRLVGLALAILLTAAILGPRWAGGADDPAVDSPPAPPASSESPRAGDQQSPPSVRLVGHSLLPISGRWELYGRGEAEVVRIELAEGRITRTVVPHLLPAGPVSFLVSGNGVLLRPLGPAPGYWVPDGRPARPLRAGLGQGDPILPGPEPGEVWVPSTSRYSNRTLMLLASVTREAAREVTVLPSDTSGSVAADGAGSFYFSATGGTYGPGRGGFRRITTGTVIAAGPRTFLTAECDEQHRCRHLLTDRSTGTRRQVRLLPSFDVSLALASVSPDGRYAAVMYRLATSPLTLHLIDLKTGRDRPVRADFGPSLEEGSLVWSPDSAYLFALSAGGRLTVVDSATARSSLLRASLPPLRQLALKR